MYGGDWPLTVPYGGYRAAWSVYADLIGTLTPGSRSGCGGVPPATPTGCQRPDETFETAYAAAAVCPKLRMSLAIASSALGTCPKTSRWRVGSATYPPV